MILFDRAPDSTQGPDLGGRALCSVSTRRALGRTRTCNLLIRSQVLYPLSYERTGRLPAPTEPGYPDGRAGVKLGRWSRSTV
jgi:hypothetical protein